MRRRRRRRSCATHFDEGTGRPSGTDLCGRLRFCRSAHQGALEASRDISTGAPRLGLHVRAGLHAGEIEITAADIAGLAVHIAARVSALARPDEVLVSSTRET